jgi:O-antigen/teichoic acid export membrane protein
MLQNLIKNTVWRSLADVFARLGSALFWILLARFLGAGAFGAVSFALALMGFFELVASLGLGSVLTRDAAQNPAAAAAYFGHMLILGMASAAAGTLLMIAAAWLIRPDQGTLIIAIAMAVLLPLTSVAYWSRAMLSSAEKMQYISLGTLTENAILIVLGLGLLFAGQGMRAVLLALILSKVAAAILLYGLACRETAAPVWRLEKPMTGYLLRQVPLFLLIAIFNGLFWSITVVIITWSQGEAAAGYFSAAYKLISYVLLFAVAFSQALLPVAAKLARQDRALYEQLLRRALHYLAIFFLGAALLLSLLAEPIVRLLYGPGMAGAVPVLRILAWMVLPYGLIPALAYTLVSHHQPRRDMWANLAGAVTVVTINLILVPRLSAVGGAVAMVAGSALFAAFEFASVTRLLYPLRPERRTLTLLVSAGLMALALVGLHGANLFIRGFVACTVYAAALWFLRGVDRRELIQLLAAARPQRTERMA